jgi:hypothetical protein
MQKTLINPNAVQDEFLTVYLLAVNRMAELRVAARGMVNECDSLAALGRLKKLQTQCGALERLVFPERSTPVDTRF